MDTIRICLSLWALVCIQLVFLPPSWGGEAASPENHVNLKFQQADNGEYFFDTGILRGKLRAGGKSLGLSEVVHLPSGKRLDRSNGLLSHYRVFTANRRYGGGAWDYPSTASLLPDGAVEVRWPAAEDRPFALTATYRWMDPATLDLVTTVQAQKDLAGFESFLASYCSESFTHCQLYLREPGDTAGVPRWPHALKSYGDWLMSPRSPDVVPLIQDGRWKLEPNPVDWKILNPFAGPLGIRSDPGGGLAIVLMALPQDCFALATPHEAEGHYSFYQCLFGRDLKAGETVSAKSRLWIATGISTEAAERQYHKFVLANEPHTGRTPGVTKTRVLLVTGQDYPGHPWRQTAPALADSLQRDPRLQVNVSEDPHLLDSSALFLYDTIILHFMNWEQPAPGGLARENLRRFVEQGGGMVLVHFACGAWQDWPEFANLAGRVWDPKLRGHDPRGPFKVQILDRQHPITAGLADFEIDDELYTCLAGDRPIQILAQARSQVDGKDYPMAFVFTYGQGHVFHSPLGHDVKAITNPAAIELFRRGCLWAARRPVL